MINSASSSNKPLECGTLLQAAFAVMTEAIAIYDADGRLIEFNDEFIRFHRFTARDECSRSISDCLKFLDVRFADGTPVPPEQWALPRALRGETSSNIEYRLHHKETGETWWGSYNFSPMKDKHGKITGAVVTGHEITQHKQAEEALRDSEERLALAVSASRAMVYDMDPSTGQILAIRGAEALVGCAPGAGEMNMRWWDARIHPEDLASCHETLESALRQPGQHRLKYRVRHTEKRWLFVEGHATVVCDDVGRPVRIVGTVVDITERNRAEQNEEMFATLLEHNPSLLFLKDEEGRYVYLNSAYEKQYALMPDWLGKTDFDFWPKESAELFRRNDAEVLEYGKVCQFLEDSLDLNGNRHCWLCYKFPFADSQGRHYVGGIGIDSTARVLAEEALRGELERARLLHEVSTELILAENTEALYEKILDTAVAAMHSDFASLQVLETEGKKAGELQLLGYRGFSQHAAKFWEWVNPGSESTCGIALRTKQRVFVPDVRNCEYMDGSEDLACYLETGIVAVQTTPLVSRSGELLGMLSTHWRETHEPTEGELRALDVLARQAADLLARKRAEEALRESEKRMQLALHVGHSYAFEWQAHNDTVVRSDSCSAILGLSGPEAIHDTGTQFFERIHPDHRIPFQQILKGLTPANRCYYTEYRIQRPDGTIVVLEETGEATFDRDGALVQVVGIVTDITEHRRVKDELRQLNAKLEQRVAERTGELRKKDQQLLIQGRQAALGEMLGNIAHQWRQPLNVLGMLVQQLSLRYDHGQFTKELLEETVGKSMNIIKHMSSTIDDFRNYFAPDKEKTDFRLAGAVANSMSLIADSLKSKHIEFETIEMADPIVHGYRNEFAQALLNILNNAADALVEKQPANPTITVTVTEAEKRAIVTIRDNAGGIPEKIIDHIFDPYFTTKGPHHGTGIGLFMSKAIIEKNMGGRLTVSNTGDGAEFRLEL